MAQPDFRPIESYGATGDGRSVALITPDGSVDWWCVPTLDGKPLFDRLVAGPDGTSFSLQPDKPFKSEQKYINNTNVLQTVFSTDDGVAVVTDSLNSGLAGRLPWSEMGRRIEVISGRVRLVWWLSFGSKFSDQPVERLQAGLWRGNGYTVGLLNGDQPMRHDNDRYGGSIELRSGSTATIGLVVTYQEPLPLPTMQAIDTRIAISTDAWRQWVDTLSINGPYAVDIRRSALALKLLWHSPSGAIAAAATTSLPERIGGSKNYDYRYGWVRDTAYSLKALIRCGATEEVQASLAWLLRAIRNSDGIPQIFYTLAGERPANAVKEISVRGYEDSRPVRIGNTADGQLQLGIYGDIFEAISVYVDQGNAIDEVTGEQLLGLAEQVTELWQKPDSGIWELDALQHYTMSKIGCWLALDKAIGLAAAGHIPDRHLAGWKTCRQMIYNYIETRCWDESRRSYVMYAGSDKLDAALLLATRFGYPNMPRLAQTLRAVTTELADGPLYYRYSGVQTEEGTFTACSFWAVEAEAFVGDKAVAKAQLAALLPKVKNHLGLMSEQVDAISGRLLGNVPQALSHLAFIHAVDAVSSD